MANKDKKEYNLGYVRVTMPNHPDMKNQPAVIKVGGENLEDILGGGSGSANTPAILAIDSIENLTASQLASLKAGDIVKESAQGFGPTGDPLNGTAYTVTIKGDAYCMLVSMNDDTTFYSAEYVKSGDQWTCTYKEYDIRKHFKGWWPDLASLKAAHTASEGDSAYVKDASPATTWSIYIYDSTASTDNYWADSGTDADTSNVQTFADGQEVNDVHIVNDFTGGVNDVASAETVKVLNENKLEKQVVEHAMTVLQPTGNAVVGYLLQNGNITSTQDNCRVETFQVVAGETYYLTGRCATAGSRACAAFYDDSDVLVGDAIIGNPVEGVSARNIVDEPHIAPSTATKVKVSTSHYISYPISCKVKTIISTQDNQAILESVGDVSELETTEKETVVGAINEVVGEINDVASSVVDMQGDVDDLNEFVEELNGVHLPEVNENIDISVTSGSSYSGTTDVSLQKDRIYNVTLDENAPISTSSVAFKDENDVSIPFYIIGVDTNTRTSYNPGPSGAAQSVNIRLTKDAVGFKCNISSSNITATGTVVFTIHSDKYDEDGRLNLTGSNVDVKDSTSAYLAKQMILQDSRGYFFGGSPKISGEIDSYSITSYLDKRISEIPEGKHFIFFADTHIDYYSYAGLLQKQAIIMKYVRERAGIRNVIFGGDCIGGGFSNYKAAEILQYFASECFDNFGKDMIYAQGNHDCNSVSPGEQLISDAEVYKRIGLPMKQYGIAVYDDKFLKAIDDLDSSLLTSEQKSEAKAWGMLHYRYDDESEKIRYIVLETGDNGNTNRLFTASGSTYAQGMYAIGYMMTDFLIDSLNSVPEGYDVVVAGHEIDTAFANNSNPQKLSGWIRIFYQILDAYKKKSTCEITNQPSTNLCKQIDHRMSGKTTYGRSCDFSNHKGSGFLLVISGHFHRDATRIIAVSSDITTTSDTVTYIDKTNNALSKDAVIVIDTDRTIFAGGNSTTAYLNHDYVTHYPDDSVTTGYEPDNEDYIVRSGTVDEVLFDVFTITPDKNIRVTRFGCNTFTQNGSADYDRSYDFIETSQ